MLWLQSFWKYFYKSTVANFILVKNIYQENKTNEQVEITK